MADALSLDLYAKNLVTDQLILTINYDRLQDGYTGEMQADYYGRFVPKPAHGSVNLDKFTNSNKKICDKVMFLYHKIINSKLNIRRINLVANHVKVDDGTEKPRQLDIFTDYAKESADEAKEKRLQSATLEIKKRYGKNSILKAANFEEGATMRIRNRQVGGHRA